MTQHETRTTRPIEPRTSDDDERDDPRLADDRGVELDGLRLGLSLPPTTTSRWRAAAGELAAWGARGGVVVRWALWQGVRLYHVAVGASESGTNLPGPLGRGRAGAVRGAFRRAVADAREAGRIRVADEVLVALGDLVAAAADRAARDGDAAAVLRATDKLSSLMESLPLAAPAPVGGGESGAGSGGDGGLRVVMGGPPSVGDAADA